MAALACLALTAAAQADPAHRPAPDDAHDAHEIRLAEREQVLAGDSGTLSLTIAPRPGYSISRQGPLSIDLAANPEAGIELPRSRYHRGHAADARADAPRFDLLYKAVKPGRYSLRVDLRFWVCGSATCWPVRALRTVQIDARSPP